MTTHRIAASMPVPADEFDKAYKLHRQEVHNSILRITGNAAVAEEIVQETFIRFLEKGDSARPEKYRGFLFFVAHNLAVDYVKKQSRVNNYAEIPDQAANVDTAGEVEAKILREKMLVCLAAENELYVHVFVMRVDLRMNQREIAENLDISERTVIRYLAKIRDLIGDFL